MTQDEMLDALRRGEKICSTQWEEYGYLVLRDNKVINCRPGHSDREAILDALFYQIKAEPGHWKLYEEPKPELKLKPKHICRTVRLRNGTITPILAWIEKDDTWPVRTFLSSNRADGKYFSDGKESEMDIVEVLE